MGVLKIPDSIADVSTDIFFRVENIPVQSYAWNLITVKSYFLYISISYNNAAVSHSSSSMKHI